MAFLPEAGRRRRFRSLSLSLLFGLAAALLAWIFVQLGSEMAEGETRAFDMAILRAMQTLRDSHSRASVSTHPIPKKHLCHLTEATPP